MKVTALPNNKPATPVFTAAQLEYLERVFTHKLSTGLTYSLEMVNFFQGQLEVVEHVRALLKKQQS